MDNSLSLIHAKTSKQYASTSTREFFFFLFLKIFIDTEREVLKVCKDKIKMVLQVTLRRKTTSSVKIFICRESIAHAIARAGDNIHVIRSQSSQTKKLNFLTWPDLAFGFVNKRSGYEITDSKGLFIAKLLGVFLPIETWKKQSSFSPISDSTLEYWTFRWLPFRSDYFCIE